MKVLACFLILATITVPAFVARGEEPRTKNKEPGTEVFRPEAGKFPPLEKAKAYMGQLAFVDHANRYPQEKRRIIGPSLSTPPRGREMTSRSPGPGNPCSGPRSPAIHGERS